VKKRGGGAPVVVHEGKRVGLREVTEVKEVVAGTWVRRGEGVVVCFDLSKGRVAVGV
jgi:hypothetical protein